MSDLELLLEELEADLDNTYLVMIDNVSKKSIEYYLKGKKTEFEKFNLALGEWAWETYLGWKEHWEKVDDECTKDISKSCGMQYEEIAIACLGKEIIEERKREIGEIEIERIGKTKNGMSYVGTNLFQKVMRKVWK